MNRAWGVSVLLVFLVVGPRGAWAQVVIQPDEANVDITNDMKKSSTAEMSVGDFNGDGLDDVAVRLTEMSNPSTVFLFLSPLEKNGFFSARASAVFVLNGPGRSLSLPSSRMADLDHDGKDDLILHRRDSTSFQSQLLAVRGSTAPRSSIDLGSVQADMTLVGPVGVTFESGVTVGDFNGDKKDDLAVMLSSESSSVCYFVLGGSGFNPFPVNVEDPTQFPRLVLSGYGREMLTGNLNGDSRDDLVIGTQFDDREDVVVFFGTSPFPVAGGVAASANVTVLAYYRDWLGDHHFFRPSCLGDITGDHKDELIVEGFPSPLPLWILDGVDLSGKGPLLRQQAATPESIPFYPIAFETQSFERSYLISDFDWDGVEDFFTFNDSGMNGRLSSDMPSGVFALDNLGSSGLGWNGRFKSIGTGDFNGDGYQDLIAYEDFRSIYSPFGAVRILFGFRPLTIPRISVVSGPDDRRRVTLSLSVEGAPTEMLFSGDLDSSLLTGWVPFRSPHEVLLSPGGGSKTIGVRFRNAVGRESETVETSVPVAVGNTPVVTDTNRLRPGGVVSFECHARAPGTLRADLFGPGGERILELENRSVESGIYPVQWNGQNAHGNRVARGVYYLAIEVDGERTRKEILVE